MESTSYFLKAIVGLAVSPGVGDEVSKSMGALEGESTGCCVGTAVVGSAVVGLVVVGDALGDQEGAMLGEMEGTSVGSDVGSAE